MRARFGFCRYLQPLGRSRRLTAGQRAVSGILADNVSRLLSPRLPRTLDDLTTSAARVAARLNTEPTSREQLALELVLLLEHGLARLEPLPDNDER
jgi:hypothetical protein